MRIRDCKPNVNHIENVIELIELVYQRVYMSTMHLVFPGFCSLPPSIPVNGTRTHCLNTMNRQMSTCPSERVGRRPHLQSTTTVPQATEWRFNTNFPYLPERVSNGQLQRQARQYIVRSRDLGDTYVNALFSVFCRFQWHCLALFCQRLNCHQNGHRPCLCLCTLPDTHSDTSTVHRTVEPRRLACGQVSDTTSWSQPPTCTNFKTMCRSFNSTVGADPGR